MWGYPHSPEIGRDLAIPSRSYGAGGPCKTRSCDPYREETEKDRKFSEAGQARPSVPGGSYGATSGPDTAEKNPGGRNSSVRDSGLLPKAAHRNSREALNGLLARDPAADGSAA